MTDVVSGVLPSCEKSEAEQRVFSTSLFGFKRAQVLDYIESLVANNAAELAKSTALYDAVSAELKINTQTNAALQEELDKTQLQLKSEQLTAAGRSAELSNMRISLDKTSDERDSFKSRLFSSEQDNASLKADNSRLNTTINSLTFTVNEYEARKDKLNEQEISAKAQADRILQEAGGVALATKRDAQIEAQAERDKILADARLAMENADVQAQSILDKAGDDAVELLAQAQRERDTGKILLTGSCEDIAQSVEMLKHELAEVDSKITKASAQLQNAAKGIATALENTEKNLDLLGVQTKYFPNPAPAVHSLRQAGFTRAPHTVHTPLHTERRRHTVADSILDRLARILG